MKFPNESKAYRAARNKLLEAEGDLRAQVEKVAALRRKLPAGGAAADYVFDAAGGKRVKLSQLFAKGKDTLVLYSFMYGPKMEAPCPMCTCMLDSLDRTAPHATQRINLAVVAKSPLARIEAFARGRGWANLRLLSAAENDYQRDYGGEDERGAQLPALNVFAKDRRGVRHVYNTELLYAKSKSGQDARHIDMIWPLWNLFDFTPDGRGEDWYPRLTY
jgi:predicted dithiol-disulfide oxidoreductase (DUF899 family)